MSNLTKGQWKNWLYDKVTKNKSDRVFLTNQRVGWAEDRSHKHSPHSRLISSFKSQEMSTDAFHVLKFIPYKKRNARASSSSSTSNSDSNISQYTLDSSVESSTDSELKHVSTPSDKSSASSREEEVDRDN